MTVKQFIDEGLTKASIDEFLRDRVARAGYGGAEVNRTPRGTQVQLWAEKPGMVIGKGGRNIRELESDFAEKFDIEDLSIEVKEVENPNLNGQIVAHRLAQALERGWYFRKAGYSTLRDIMDSGALGAEIVLKGKVTGSRSREEKFRDGYMKHCGEPADDIVDEGYAMAKKKLGTIGVTVKIVPPDVDIPDKIEIRELETEEEEELQLVAEPGEEEAEEELEAEPEAAEAVEEAEEPEAEAAEAVEEAEEEVVEAEPEEPEAEAAEAVEEAEEPEAEPEEPEEPEPEGTTEEPEPEAEEAEAEEAEEKDHVECLECGAQFKQITGSHLATHDMDMDEYKEKHGEDVETRA